MPPHWLHDALDLAVFGRVYPDLHTWKDAPAKTLRWRHRAIRHDWYNAYDTGVWTFNDPFPPVAQWEIVRRFRTEGPDAAERYEVDLSHDLYDRVWDTLSRRKRIAICEWFKWMLLHPEELKRFAQIDVVAGRALTEDADGNVTWQDEPGLNVAWQTLKAHVEGRPVEDLVDGR